MWVSRLCRGIVVAAALGSVAAERRPVTSGLHRFLQFFEQETSSTTESLVSAAGKKSGKGSSSKSSSSDGFFTIAQAGQADETIGSDYPSMVPSDAPSFVPSDVPSSMPSDQPSMVPSDMPSVVPSDLPSMVPSDMPSMIPSDLPSMIPSDLPSIMPSDLPSTAPSQQFGREATVESFSLGGGEEVMDEDTVEIFEDVCKNEFLPTYLPQVYPAEYSDIDCNVLSQSMKGRLRQRRMQETADLELGGDNVSVLMRASAVVDLPPGQNFQDILHTTFAAHGSAFEESLQEASPYFKESNDREAAASTQLKSENRKRTGRIAAFIFAGLAGVVLLVAAALNARQQRRQRFSDQEMREAELSLLNPNSSTSSAISQYDQKQLAKFEEDNTSASLISSNTEKASQASPDPEAPLMSSERVAGASNEMPDDANNEMAMASENQFLSAASSNSGGLNSLPSQASQSYGDRTSSPETAESGVVRSTTPVQFRSGRCMDYC